MHVYKCPRQNCSYSKFFKDFRCLFANYYYWVVYKFYNINWKILNEIEKLTKGLCNFRGNKLKYNESYYFKINTK